MYSRTQTSPPKGDLSARIFSRRSRKLQKARLPSSHSQSPSQSIRASINLGMSRTDKFLRWSVYKIILERMDYHEILRQARELHDRTSSYLKNLRLVPNTESRRVASVTPSQHDIKHNISENHSKPRFRHRAHRRHLKPLPWHREV